MAIRIQKGLRMGQSGMRRRTIKRPIKGPQRPKTCLALTGSIASGKSTALKAFKRLGWEIASADQMIHELYQEHSVDVDSVRREISQDPRRLQAFEKKFHPLVRKKILKLRREAKKPLMVEIPLLFEAKFEKYFDQSLYIFTDKKTRLKRARERGMTTKLFEQLEKKQLTPREKTKKADFVLINQTKLGLRKQVQALHRFLVPGTVPGTKKKALR